MSPSSESVWELQGWEPGLCYPGEGLAMGPGQLGSIHQAAEGLFSLFLFNSIQFSNLFHAVNREAVGRRRARKG